MRAALPLLLILAVAGILSLLLLFGEITGGGSDGIDRLEEEEEAERLRAAEAAGLQGRVGALTPEEVAEEAARREAARRAAAFRREEGVFGRVLDGAGAPVAGATLRLSVQPPVRRRRGVPDLPALATALSDEAGEFQIGPAPTGRLRLRAEAPGYAPTVLAVQRRGYRVEIVLDRGGALEVSVRSLDGDPIGGARLLHHTGNVVTEAATDANGLALFPGLPTGSGTLSVHCDGYAGYQQKDVAVSPGRTETMTVVLGPPLVLEGQVLDDADERPVEGASLTVTYPNSPWLDASGPVQTDAQGRYEITVAQPPGQNMELTVRAGAYAAHRQWLQLADAGEGRMQHDVRLLTTTASVRGHVYTAGDQPAAGVRVTYAVRVTGGETREVVTAKDGSFRLGLPGWLSKPGGTVHVIAVSAGGGLAHGFARIPRDGSALKPLTLTLTGAGAVNGTVTTEDGAPVVGALVHLEPAWGAINARRNTGRPVDWRVLGLLQDPTYADLQTVTDDAGHYAISAVPEAGYRLSATFGRDTSTSPDAVFVNGGSAVVRNLVLGEGARIGGWVFDDAGSPVTGAHVRAFPRAQGRNGIASTARLEARTQADGGFVLTGASADTYNLTVSASGHRGENKQGISAGNLDVRLTLRRLGWIEGTVTVEGRPHRGTFSVTAAQSRQGRGNSEMRWVGGNNRRTFSTDDGRFLLRGLSEGEYRVSVQTPDGLISAGEVLVRVVDGRGTRADLELHEGAVVTGQVVSDRTGAPIAKAGIQFAPAQGDDAPSTRVAGRTDARGAFVIRGLDAGRYLVYVHPPSGIAFTTPLELTAGEKREVTLREREPGTLWVTVRDPAGHPIAGATPRVESEDGHTVWPNWKALQSEGLPMNREEWTRQTTTDAEGLNVRRHLPPGRYQVTATHPQHGSPAAAWVTIEAGGRAQIDVTLPPRSP